MKLDLHIPRSTLPAGVDAAPALARAAEDGGVETFTLEDHGSLRVVADRTRRLRLGLLVGEVPARRQELLAETVMALDTLSGGRARLELRAPPPPHPGHLEETLRVCLRTWSRSRPPGPELLVVSGGEHDALRLVARYADACRLDAPSPVGVARTFENLVRHCDAEGRDPSTIERSVVGAGDPLADADAFLRAMEEYAGLGVDAVRLTPAGPDPVAWVTRVTELVGPRLAALGAPLSVPGRPGA